MSDLTPRVTVTEVSVEGTRLELSDDEGVMRLETPAISPMVEGALREALESFSSRENALAAWRESVAAFHPLIAHEGSGPRVISDNRPIPSGDDIVAWGRILAQLVGEGRKTVMVCGGVTIDPESDYDTLGALAASLIRLRLGLFIGVGHTAKALATQVGMEGSWDGESRWAEGVAEAYDYLCAETKQDDVVLLVGLDPAAHSTLTDLLGVVSP